MALLGLIVIALFSLAGLFAPVIAPQNPLTMNLGSEYSSPSREHLLGTDELGRDVLSRIIHAARYDLGLSFVTVMISAVVGMLVGAIAAFAGGWVDTIVMRIIDIMLAFPAFLLGLALVAFVGPSLKNIVIILAISHLPRYARLIRGSVLSIQRREYVEAARVMGASNSLIIGRHILPNSIAPMIIYATLDIGIIITALAGLSFLGVGIQPPTPDWGLMLTTARNNLVIAPWTAIFPGLAISLSVMAFNFIGDGLRDALDPRAQR
jgi:peptide/nickel transport system permease protein